MVALSPQGASSCQWKGGPPGEGVVPAAGAASVLFRLSLVAVISVLQGAWGSSSGVAGLQAGAQALQTGVKAINAPFTYQRCDTVLIILSF